MASEHVERTNAVLDRIKEAGRLGGWEECHALLWRHAEDIRQYLYSFEIEGSDSGFIKPYVDDALARFFNTIDLLAGTTTGKVLEIGANPYLFTVLLRRLMDYELSLTNFFSHSVYDSKVARGKQAVRSSLFGERYEFEYQTVNIELSTYPWKPETFDKVLFCEVLEHVVVDPLKVFGKLRQILKPGGQLVLTTPNAVRLINVAHMLAGHNFFDRYHPENGIYGRHNREFTLAEVVLLLEQNGFRVTSAKTLDRYNYDAIGMDVDSYEPQTRLPWTGSQLRALLEQAGASTDNRGDNLYVVAERV